MSTEHDVEVASLLRDWIAAELKVIGEHSHNIADDWRSLVEQAQARAMKLGVPWDEELVPDYVRDILADSKTDW